MKRRSLRNRKGIALIVVFVLVMLVSLAAYRFSFEMQSEYRLAKLYEEQLLARQAANSGIEQACNLLDAPLAMRIDVVGSQETRLDTEGTPFRGLIASSDSTEVATGPVEQPWRYVLISPLSTVGNVQGERNNREAVSSSSSGRSATEASANTWRFGFENESAKIPIQLLREWERTRPGHARKVLSRIPGLDPETIDPWLIQAGILVPGPVSSITGASLSSGLDRNSPQSTTGLSSGTSAISTDRGLFAAQWLGGDLNQNYQIEAIEQRWWDKRSRTSTSLNLPEASSSSTEPIAMQRFVTKYSACRNERMDGTPRIDINSTDLRGLHRDLTGIWPQQLADFVIAMRQYGPSGNPPSRPSAEGGFSSSPSAARGGPSRSSAGIGLTNRSLAEVGQPSTSPEVNRPSTSPAEVNQPSTSPARANRSSRSLVEGGQIAQSATAARTGASISSGESVGTPDWSVPSRYQFRSLLDLVDASIQIPGAAGTPSSQTKTIASPFISSNGDNSNYLVRLLNDCAIDRSAYYEGRIDIWDAPWEVLMAIPSMDEATASRIVTVRNDASIKVQSAGTIAWLLQRSIVTLEKARELEPFLTGRSDVYSVQVVGYREERSPVFRCTMTIDGCQRPSKPQDLKTWHAWDAGFNLASFDEDRN